MTAAGTTHNGRQEEEPWHDAMNRDRRSRRTARSSCTSGTRGGPGRRRFSGRVEHLSSGESMHFSSLKGLLAFFAAALDTAAGAALRGSHDQAARARPPGFRDARSVLPRIDAAQPSCPHSSSGSPPTPTGEQTMNTMLIGVVSTVLGTVRKACGIECARGSRPCDHGTAPAPPGARRSRTRTRHPPRPAAGLRGQPRPGRRAGEVPRRAAPATPCF